MPPERIASALGTANFLRILGGSFGTSISVTMWSRRAEFHHSRLVEDINQFNPISVQVVRLLHDFGLDHLHAFGQIDLTVYKEAFMLATNDVFLVSGVLFLVLLIILWLTRPPFLTKKRTGSFRRMSFFIPPVSDV